MTSPDDVWIDVAASTAIGEGAIEAARFEGRAVALARVEGQVHAFGNVCTHGQALLADGWLDGRVIECPLHGGRFDICTGRGLCAPITEDIAVYSVREQDGRIQLAATP